MPISRSVISASHAPNNSQAARQLIDIAESASLPSIGYQMHQALTQATKDDAIGLYFLVPQRLSLQWSLGSPNGFLELLSSELGVKVPLLMVTLHEVRLLSGHTLYHRS